VAEWPCCHDPLRSSPTSHGFVPPHTRTAHHATGRGGTLHAGRPRSYKFWCKGASFKLCNMYKKNSLQYVPVSMCDVHACMYQHKSLYRWGSMYRISILCYICTKMGINVLLVDLQCWLTYNICWILYTLIWIKFWSKGHENQDF
jgi:hypothetical protein